MKTSITVIILVLTVSIYTYAQTPTFDNLKQIDAWLQKDIDQQKLQGAIVMVATKEGVIYKTKQGVSNIESQREIQYGDYFKIASLSKMITTVAALQLYEKGYFDLDDPIENYLPEFKDLKVIDQTSEEYQLIESKQKVTVRHLLNHTAGFTYDGPVISKIYKEKQLSFFNPTQKDLKTFMEILGTTPLVHQPGEKFTYGPSTDILGFLIESLTNQSLEAYYKEYIFTPLQMNETGFNTHKTHIDRLVRSYSLKKDTLKPINKKVDLDTEVYNRVFMGGSGLISTAADYIKFCQMLLNNGNYKGNKIISRKSIEMMTSNQIGALDYPKGFHPILGKGNKFGFGVNIITEEGKNNELYSKGSYYWEGAYTTTMIADPKEGFVALLMTQMGGRASLKIRKDFRKTIYSALN